MHREGRMPFQDGETWYRITGTPGLTPLVILHGGPGATHDYCDSFRHLAETGRIVVHYDQFGCGHSSHRPDWGADRWTVQLFRDELDALLAHLGIADGYHLLGQSWGGMLAAEHAVRRPSGLKSLIIANSPASMRTWVAEANTLRAALPPEVQATLLHHETTDTTADPAYAAAVQVFYERHLCRVVPFPDDLMRSLKALETDPTVYMTMNGPSEFHVIGTLKDWTIEDRLPLVTAPTLVYRGEFDEATAECVRPYVERIPGARSLVFAGCSHTPHIESTHEVITAIASFLAPND